MTPDPALRASAAEPRATLGYRQLILALVGLGALGLLTELLLLEHFESAWQWSPVVALALTLVTVVGVAARPSRGTLRAFQLVMVSCVILGAIGVYLHVSGNVEFELESAPDLRGWALYWESIRGAVPALAPGAMAQLGLLGLLFSYRHPAVTPQTPPADPAGDHAQSDQEQS